LQGIKPVIKNSGHRDIIKYVNMGLDDTSVIDKTKYSRSTVQRIKRKYSEFIEIGKPLDNIEVTATNYSADLIKKAKHVGMRLATTLQHKSLAGASLGQLTSSLVNINTLVRLEQGKSTENIAHQVLHNLNEDQMNLIKESIMKLKKSMLV